MDIVDGGNLYVEDGCIADLLDTPTAKITWKLSRKDQHVICIREAQASYYYLVRSRANVEDAVYRGRGVMWDFVDDILGFVNVDHADPADLCTVDAVWLDPSMRGKGYGEGLHRLAYEMSGRGIRSSTDLGTMSLSTLIRLYRKEPAIQLVYDGAVLPRDLVRTGDAALWCGDLDLCSPKTGEFWFDWPKRPGSLRTSAPDS
jgi:GNAT superfamily N-acetyltransferase